MPPRPRNSHLLEQVRLGDEIEVWWPHDAQYYSGVVGSRLPSGRHRILYNDGEVEDLRLATEQWRFIGAAAERVLATQTKPPSLDVASSAVQSQNYVLRSNSPAENNPVSESTSIGKTPSGRKRRRPKGRKSDSTKSATSKITRARKTSAETDGNTTDGSGAGQSLGTSSAPRTSGTKIKKRQRSSSTTTQPEKEKTASEASASEDPSFLNVGSGLIDAAPLLDATANPSNPSHSFPSTPRPSSLHLTPVVVQFGYPIPNIDAPQQKLSADRQKTVPTTFVTPVESATKPLTVKPSSVFGNPQSNVVSPNSHMANAKDTTLADQQAPTASEVVDLQSSRRGTSSSSLGVNNTPNPNNVPPRIQQHPPKEEAKDKHKTKSIGKDMSGKKGSATANMLDKEDTSIRPSEARRGQTYILRPTPSQQSSPANAKSTTDLLQEEQHLTNGDKTLKAVPAMTSGPSRHGEKGVREIAGKKMEQSKETHGSNATCPSQAQSPKKTCDVDATTDDLAKQNSTEDRAKMFPDSAQGNCTESSPTPKTLSDSDGPLMALMANVAVNSESRGLPSDTMGKSPTSRSNAASGPLQTNSKATSSPRSSVGGIIKRRSRSSADVKGTSKSKGGNLGKLSAVKKTISKPTRSALKKQTTVILPSRKQADGSGRKAAVNPDDGRDIIADVNVPRKPRSGPASPLLRSPLSGLKRPVFSPGKAGSKSGPMVQKATSGADLKNFSLQLAPATSPSLRVDRSSSIKGERAGSKLGPFQPTKRRSAIHRQGVASQVDQRNATNLLSKSAHSKTINLRTIRDKEQRILNRHNSLRSDIQLDEPVTPALSNNVPDHANQVSSKSKQQSQIPDSEQSGSDTRRRSGDEPNGRNSQVKEPKSPGSGQAKENSKELVRETAQESIDHSKQSDESAENVAPRAKSDMVDTHGDVSRPQGFVSRKEQRDGNVDKKDNGTVRASTTPVPILTTTRRSETCRRVNRHVKRTASEQMNNVKRRKLDSCEKQDLEQVFTSKTAPEAGSKSSHVPKMLPESLSPACQHLIKEQDKVSCKENSLPVDSTTKSPIPKFSQTEQATTEVAKGDNAETLVGGERVEKSQQARAELVSSRKFQIELADSTTARDKTTARKLKCVPSVDTSSKAAVSTAPLPAQKSESLGGTPIEKGVAIAQLSTQHRDLNSRCPESFIQTPAFSELVIAKEVGAELPNGEDQHAEESQNLPLQSAEASNLQELHPTSMTTTRTSPHQSQPSIPAPRSFARVRARQSTGSVAGDVNLSLSARLPQDSDGETTSFQLDILTRTITEANRKSLQEGFAAFSTRFEKFFTDNDKFLTSLQDQVDKATKAVESLQEGIAGARNAVSSIPSTKEIRTFLENHTEETKQAMTQELKNVTSELKYIMHDYLKRELESAMKSVAAQIQRDSVMLISKAIDNAMSSGLMHEHPRITNNGGEEVVSGDGPAETIRDGRKEANKGGDLARYAGMDSDDVPLVHRFGLKVSAEKDGPLLFAKAVAPSSARAIGQSQLRTTAWNDVSSPKSQVGNGTAGNPHLLEKGKALVRPQVLQNTQNTSQKPDRNSLSSSPAANASGKERSTLPDVSRKPTIRECDAQNSTETVCWRDKKATVSQQKGSKVKFRDRGVHMRSNAPESWVFSDMSPNLSHVHVAGRKTQENAKRPPKRNPARRERCKELTLQVRTLLARCAVEWFLSGGCRDFAPADERTKSVSAKWVKDSVHRCLDGIVRRLENEETFEGAMKDLADSVGPGIQTDWLLQSPTVSNIDKARENYTEWDPQLQDFEWESEKRVLRSLSEKIICSEQSLVRSDNIYEDLLHTAVRYLEDASQQKVTPSDDM